MCTTITPLIEGDDDYAFDASLCILHRQHFDNSIPVNVNEFTNYDGVLFTMRLFMTIPARLCRKVVVQTFASALRWDEKCKVHYSRRQCWIRKRRTFNGNSWWRYARFGVEWVDAESQSTNCYSMHLCSWIICGRVATQQCALKRDAKTEEMPD